jgi:hypothetical protein
VTNATKALLLAVLNAALGVAIVFGAPLTSAQTGAIVTLGNAVGALAVALTYKRSRKRRPDNGD